MQIGKDILRIVPLGAGQEVGRSCVYLEYKEKRVLFDCGIHVAFQGQEALPLFDHIDPGSVDLLLVTHFHLDHCGAVPYFLEKTSFKGKVFMTYPTKAIFRLIMSDSAKVANPKGDNNFLFEKNDLESSLKKIEMLDYH